ncbi:MAG: hypothetical protein DHS20C06_02920 [Hyphobacterium sp.]|nr:MAG: hypothetical protein DHS20C06_02920 [Hyphobacterium sp.]
MMPLSLARLAAASMIAVVAGLAGLAVAPRVSPAPAIAASASAGGPGPVLQSDISALSARLRETGLFPAAVPLVNADDNNPETSAAIAAQVDGESARIQAPPINALVREDGIWRLYAGGVVTERALLIEGEELYDGWLIGEIGASHVLLRRGNETLSIYVFDPPGEG